MASNRSRSELRSSECAGSVTAVSSNWVPPV